MHILGSKIIGQDIHLVVPNGLKLEASKYTDKSLIFCSESGFKIGFYHKGKNEGGFRAAATVDSDQQKLWDQHLNSSELVASNALTIMAKDGTFEQISSDISAKIIQVEARNWQAKTYDTETITKHIEQHAELGIKLAVKQNVTNVIDKVKMLVTKKGSHVVDNLDRVFKAYDAYKSLAMLPTNAVNVGLYAYLSASQSEEMTCSTVAVDNIINGETIIAHVKDDIRFQGVKMTAKDVDFAATNFTFETSSDKYNYQYDFRAIDIEIDLDTGVNSSLSASTQNVESTSTIHHPNYIKVSGNLKITLSGDGKFKGVTLEGMNVDIKANNLVVESVQDIVSERLMGANLNIGFNKEYNFTGFGGGVESGFKEKAWTSQVARIIGSQLVNIIVKETLEIAGGLIANGEEDKNGKLTDKGNLSVNCGRMVVKTIHDYDQGLTLGIGANFQVKHTEEQTGKGKRDVSFHHAPVKVQFKDHQQIVSSTIGKGQVTSGSISGDQLNRDISQHKQITKEEQASFDSTVHGDMLKTVLGTKEEVKRPPDITKIPKDELSKTLPKMIGHYFSGIFDNIKQAAKDVIIKGAKTANIFGAEINTKQLGKNLDRGNDWHFGSNLSPAEIQEFEKQFAANYQNLEGLEELAQDGEDEQVTKNKQKYFIFFQNLEDEVTQAEANGGSKADLQAMLHISQVLYKKEQSDAIKEGRPIKDFGEFVGHLNQHIYNDSIFAGKVHDNIVKILLKTQLVVDQKYAIIGGGDKIEQTKGVEGKDNHGRKGQQVATTSEIKENLQDTQDTSSKKEQPLSTESSQQLNSEIVETIKTIKTLITELETVKQQATGVEKHWYKSRIASCHQMIEALEMPHRSYGEKMNELNKRHLENTQTYIQLLGEDNVEDGTIINLHATIDSLGMHIKHLKELIGEETTKHFPGVKSAILGTVGVATDNVKKLINWGMDTTLGKDNSTAVKEGIKQQLVKVVNWSYKNLEEGDREVVLDTLTFLPIGKITSIISGKNIAKTTTEVALKDASVSAATSALKSEHYAMVKAHIERLVENDILKLDTEQIKHFSKATQKEFLKYQSLDDILTNKHMINIVGKAQHTGTPGHADACVKLANQYAKKPEVELVFMNQGINKIASSKFPTNIRPDITIVYKDGTIDFIEIMSKTDTMDVLKNRIGSTMKRLPDAVQGEKLVKDIKEVLEK